MSLDLTRLASLDQSTGNGILEFHRMVFGTEPWEEQIEWALKGIKPLNLLSPGNSWGKTEYLARDGIRRAWYKLYLNSPRFWWALDPHGWFNLDWRGLTAAYEHDTAQESWTRLMLAIDRKDPVADMVKIMHRTDPPDLTLLNGSILNWGTLSEGGKHVEATRRQYIAIDEVGHVLDFKTIYADVLKPRTLGARGQMFLYGTPKEYTDPFVEDLFELGQDPEAGIFSMSGDATKNPYWADEDRSLFWSDPVYVNPDGTLTPKGRQVALGDFLGRGGRFFKRGHIAQMFSGEHDWYTLDQWRGAVGHVINSWDLGSSKKNADATVGIAIDTRERPYRVGDLHYIPREDLMPWSEKLDLIQTVWRNTGADYVALDITGGVSDAVEEELTSRGMPIYPFALGGAGGVKKRTYLRSLQTQMERQYQVGGKTVTGLYRYPKELRYPELANRKAEFVNYRYPDDANMTTDTVMAHMMAAQIIEEFMAPPSLTGRQVY